MKESREMILRMAGELMSRENIFKNPTDNKVFVF
jgi:hypothetical protein